MLAFPGVMKLLVLAAILLAVWFGFRLLGQLDRARKEEARLNQGGGRRGWASRRADRRSAGGTRRAGGRAETADIQDMTKCPTCGAYVPAAGTTACGRADCPY